MPEPAEIEWRQVVEGDQLKSVKTQKFYPVLRTQALTGGKTSITIQAGAKTSTITRPTPEEPKAVVIRGDTGAVVDIFIDVFSSR